MEANLPGLSVGRFRVRPRETRPAFCRLETMADPFRERASRGVSYLSLSPVYTPNGILREYGAPHLCRLLGMNPIDYSTAYNRSHQEHWRYGFPLGRFPFDAGESLNSSVAGCVAKFFRTRDSKTLAETKRDSVALRFLNGTILREPLRWLIARFGSHIRTNRSKSA